DALVRETPSLVWLGYTIHGNEASGAEASLATLYQLAAGNDAETRTVLDSAVVLIDPVQNPDGHERHVQHVLRTRGTCEGCYAEGLDLPAHPAAMVNGGQWPGGRTNHYLFDLNRDWFIHAHPESRGRTAAFLDWMPHVAVDLHEMGSNSTYFFAPPMEPINKNVPQSILDGWGIFAEANAGALDAAGGKSYFTREGYDEFWPGYGISWPVLTGAIGMTYEQASSSGGAIRRDDGTILTLHEAATHHYTTGWATAFTAARRRTDRVNAYVAFRRGAIEAHADGPMRSIVFGPDGQGRADSLAHLLLGNGIEVHRLNRQTTMRATRYGQETPDNATIPAGAYVVDLAQPQGRLAKAILEPDAELDSAFIREELERRRTGRSDRFYDLTAWSLPFAYRVPAWWSDRRPDGLEPVAEQEILAAADAAADGMAFAREPARYGYAFAPGSEASIRMLAGLLADSARVWYAPYAFRIGGADFPDGAFLVRVARNDDDVHEVVERHARASGADVAALHTALVDEGTDLGSNSVEYVRPPRVALVGGSPASAYSHGAAWFAFDRRIRYPVTTVELNTLPRVLDDFDVVVLPEVWGSLAGAMGESGARALRDWVRDDGGVLITLGGATSWLASEGSGLSDFRTLPDTARADGQRGAPLPKNVPGALARLEADTLSPLLAGVDRTMLPGPVSGGTVYAAPDDFRPGEIVARYVDDPDRVRLSGYFWPESTPRLAGSPYLWTESVGAGRVIAFTQDPNYRDLWRGWLPIFANAVLLGASF
ncbi:MAG: M14 family zinc carboxypeptidase, partial [Gemmatimonadota bacterium]